MITLDTTILWLFKYETSHIRPDVNNMVNKMREQLKDGNEQEARKLQVSLLELAKQLRDEKEVNEILVEGAITASKLGEHAQAVSLFKESVSRAWSDLHRRAVIRSMMGCVQWSNPLRDESVVVTWREALTDFEKLIKQPGLSPKRQQWYQELYGEVEKSLIEVLGILESDEEDIVDASASDEVYEWVQETQSEKGETASEEHEQGTERSLKTADMLQIFTVSDVIPAGGFGPSGVDSFPIGSVEVDCLYINGKPYSIHTTRGKKVINLKLDPTTSVVKVKGDSMDQENIMPGDYVLVRGVDNPNNGDLVLAEVTGIDPTATLKRYYREEGTVTLQPRSNNPIHQPFVFNQDSEDFHIRRIVVAILKAM